MNRLPGHASRFWWVLSFGLWWGTVAHLIPRAPEPYHEFCIGSWMCHSLTSPPLVPYSMRVPVRLRSGWGRFWLSPCRLCQALWSGFGPSSVRLSFPLPFSVCPLWARCVGVGVCSFLSPLAFPVLCPGYASCHFILMFMSLSSSFHRPCCGRAWLCVCTMWIDVKLLLFAGGRWGTLLQCFCEANAACFLFFIHIAPPLCAF